MKKKIKIHFEGSGIYKENFPNRKVEYVSKFIDETPKKLKEGDVRSTAQYNDVAKASYMELKFYQAVKVDERFDKHDLEVQRILTPVRYGIDNLLAKQVEVKANFSEAVAMARVKGRKRSLDDCLRDKKPLSENLKKDKAVQTNILPSIRDVFPDLFNSTNIRTNVATVDLNQIKHAKIQFQDCSAIAEKKWGNAKAAAENKKENSMVSRFV